jgi:predicted dehydrogenase
MNQPPRTLISRRSFTRKERTMPEKSNRSKTSQATRRQFLARSAMAGTAAVGSLALARGVHAAGSDVLKIGLIGCGGRGSGAVVSALSVHPGARLTAMFDPFRDRAEQALERLKKRNPDQVNVDDDHIFSDFDGYRQLLESGVDVAILGEPPHFRPMHLQACVDAGVHVFAEKPMAVDAPGVRRVLTAGEKARQKNLSFVSGFETRYGEGARQAVKRLHDGAIGDILAIQGTYNVGPLWHRGREADWTEMQFQMRNWYYFTWLSGDHIVEQHVHFYDVVGWLMQDEPPLHAWGYGGRQVRTDPKWGDIFDHHAVVCDYPNGTRVYGFTRQQPGCYNDVSYDVIGSKGRFTKERRKGWVISDLARNPIWESGSDAGHPELTTFREMFAGIQSGQPVNDSLSMGRSTMLAILGRMATHGGQLVTWDEAFDSQIDLTPQSYAWNADPPAMPGEDGKYPVPIPGVTKTV